MIKINMKPVAIESSVHITICPPSRRYKNVSLTTYRKVKLTDQIISRVIYKKAKADELITSSIDNRVFKI